MAVISLPGTKALCTCLFCLAALVVYILSPHSAAAATPASKRNLQVGPATTTTNTTPHFINLSSLKIPAPYPTSPLELLTLIRRLESREKLHQTPTLVSATPAHTSHWLCSSAKSFYIISQKQPTFILYRPAFCNNHQFPFPFQLSVQITKL